MSPRGSGRRHEEAARWWFRKETLLVALLRRDAAAGTTLRELLRAPAAPAAVPARASLPSGPAGPAPPLREKKYRRQNRPWALRGEATRGLRARAGLGTAGQELWAAKSLCLLPPKGEAGPPARPGASRATRCRPPACHMPGTRACHRHTSGDDGGGTGLGRCLLGTGIGPWAGDRLDAVDNKKENNS